MWKLKMVNKLILVILKEEICLFVDNRLLHSIYVNQMQLTEV